MAFPSAVGFPYEFPLAWGNPSGAGFPVAFPIVWTKQHAGQHCFFNFYPKATMFGDIALQAEVTKAFMGDLVIVPHFALAKMTGDIALATTAIKPMVGDIALEATLTKTMSGSIILHLPYQPSTKLKAEQLKRSYVPYVKIGDFTNQRGGRIKEAQYFKSLVKETAKIVLDNADQGLKSLDMWGEELPIDWGFLIKGTPHTVPTANLKVMSQVYTSEPGKLICTLELKGIASLMDIDKANQRWECDETYTVKQLIEGIIGATLAPFDHCQAYELVVHQTCETYETLTPGAGFFIGLNESRLDVVQFLLSHTELYMRVENDNKIHLYKDVEHSYTYSLDGEHTFFTKDNRKQGVIPNYVVVVSDQTDDEGVPLYSGFAKDTASINAYKTNGFNGEYRWFESIHIESDAEGTSVATALLANIKAQEKIIEAIVPMNCYAEVYDKVTIEDSREDTEVTGNIGYLGRYFRPGTYKMELGFGGWFNARKLRDFLKNYIPEPEHRMYFDNIPATFQSVRLNPGEPGPPSYPETTFYMHDFGMFVVPGKARLYLIGFALYCKTNYGQVHMRISALIGSEWETLWTNPNPNADFDRPMELIWTNPYINAVYVRFFVCNYAECDPNDPAYDATTAYMANGFITYDIKGEPSD